MVRKIAGILIFCLFLQQFAATASEAAFDNLISGSKVRVSPGVLYEKSHYSSGSYYEAVNLLNINLNDTYTKVGIGVPTPINTLKTTTSMASENSYAGRKVVGATNASFFMGNGLPANLLAKNNEIINYGILGENFESPTQEPVAFGITKSGKAIADYYSANLSFTVNGNTYKIDRINNVRTENTTVLYNPSQKTTGTNQWGMEIIVGNTSKNTKKLHFGDSFTGKILKTTSFAQPGDSVIPEDGFVISVQNKELAEQLTKLQPGVEIGVQLSIDPKWQDAQFILAAGPLLVKDGKVNISMPSSSSFAASRQPRTAVAVDSTGTRIFLVTVDGRQSGYSNGTSLKDLASYLISKGATAAINLDGGGSTAMAVTMPGTSYPVLVNRPSEGYENKVSAILQAVYTGNQADMIYKDIKAGAWYYDAVQTLNNEGLVTGYPDGTFRPANSITRAETAAIIARELNLKATADPNFTDVNKTHYAYSDIAAAAEKGIFIGREEGKFVPEGKLSRAEMAVILERAYELSGKSSMSFKDLKQDHWAYDSISTLAANHLVEGYPDQTFRPGNEISRAEFASFLDRVIAN